MMSAVNMYPTGAPLQEVDLDSSRQSIGSRTSRQSAASVTSVNSVTLGGVNYPVGARVGQSGLFVIGDYNNVPKSKRSSRPVSQADTSFASSTNTLSSNRPLVIDDKHAMDQWNWPLIRFCCFSVIVAGMVALLAAVIGLVIVQKANCKLHLEWWQGAVIYHVDVTDFYDADRNTYGDLDGIRQRMDYIASLGVSVVCLRRFHAFAAPGFDKAISYDKVDTRLGTIEIFDEMVKRLQFYRIKLMLEWDPVYTSDEHGWFINSRLQSPITGNKYKSFYRWENSPKNWGDWHLDQLRNQYYLQNNDTTKPMLNWASDNLVSEFNAVLTTWMDRGVDGFFIRNLQHFHIFNPSFKYKTLNSIINRWRQHLDHHSIVSESGKILMLDESYLLELEKHAPDSVEAVLENIHLIHTPVQLQENVTYALQQQVNQALRWQSTRGDKAWVSMYVTGMGSVPVEKLPVVFMYLATLPGSPALWAGQEVGRDPAYHLAVEEISPMGWKVIEGKRWIPYQYGSPLSNGSIDMISRMIDIRKNTPAFITVGEESKDVLVQQDTDINFSLLELDENTLLIERTYLRKNAYYFAVNFYRKKIVKNYVKFVSSAKVVFDSNGTLTGELDLNELKLQARQGLLFDVQMF